MTSFIWFALLHYLGLNGLISIWIEKGKNVINNWNKNIEYEKKSSKYFRFRYVSNYWIETVNKWETPNPPRLLYRKNIKKNQVSLGIKGGKQNLNFLGNFLCLVSVARVGSEKNYIHFLFLFLQNECELDQLGLFFEK